MSTQNQTAIAGAGELAIACEQRLGRIVEVAAPFELRRLSSPDGQWCSRKPKRLLIALTDEEIWLVECRPRLVGFTVGGPLCHLPRPGLVANWRHSRWAWPQVWQAELCWPYAAIYVEARLAGGNETERLIGLLAADDLDRELGCSAPALE